jgi:hydantoinase/carbamoylase family amidase
MTISSERILRDIETIAGFSEVPSEIGYSRPTFSRAWAAARDYVIDEARKAGCTVWIDSAANVHAKPAALPSGTKTWLSGSHLDSVPTGGKYDGVIGVVAPLEVLRANPDAPLELVIFAEEEGTTFNLGMLGSRAWAGTLAVDQLAGLRSRDGVDPLTAGRPYGFDPASGERIDPGRYHGLIELHAEQGLWMWKNDHPVAIVTAINGRRQYAVTVTGTPNHAGSTRMRDRADALAAAAEIVLNLETLGQELDAELDHTVLTVGQLTVQPNAINVIPGEVAFTIDFRARSNTMLSRGEERILAVIHEATGRRSGVGATVKTTETLPAEPMNHRVVDRLRSAAERVGARGLPAVASGALHDAAILAPLLPTAMLFIASQDGISHNPAEFSRIEDITLATRILAEAVKEAM